MRKILREFIVNLFWLIVFTLAFICIILVAMAWVDPETTKRLLTCVVGGSC